MTKAPLCVSVAVAALGLGAGAHATKPAISSSLDGKRVLPHRIHWLAFPTAPAADVREVDFLVDGHLVWIEHHPPYTYGLDGNWLVTSWLRPGLHRFTVTLVTTDGRHASDTVTARTLPAPRPPAPLVGGWERTVTKAEAGSQTPAGTWMLRVDASGWHITDPVGGENWIDVAYLGVGRLQARGGIWATPIESKGGNGWCEDTNASVDYAWSLSGETLTITLVGADRCGDPHNKQHFIWAGNWTKVG
jgi:hypothetical protein